MKKHLIFYSDYCCKDGAALRQHLSFQCNVAVVVVAMVAGMCGWVSARVKDGF